VKFTLTIESSNAAVVGEGAEQTVADMVAHAAAQLRDGFTSGYLRDGYSNGPAIGYWEYTPEADELEGTTSDDEDDADDDEPHPEHTQCADACGLAVTHDGPCLDKPGGRVVCGPEQHTPEDDERDEAEVAENARYQAALAALREEPTAFDMLARTLPNMTRDDLIRQLHRLHAEGKADIRYGFGWHLTKKEN
jgi:hypothetical protein